jgi:hypothetical protein
MVMSRKRRAKVGPNSRVKVEIDKADLGILLGVLGSLPAVGVKSTLAVTLVGAFVLGRMLR